MCPLCDQVQESADHLILQCVYAKEVWWHMSQETGGLLQVPRPGITMEGWWNPSVQGKESKLRQRLASLLIYTAWNIWREWNRRIFEGRSAMPLRVVALIKDEVHLRNQACGGVELTLVS